jgi:putative endopeptidase
MDRCSNRSVMIGVVVGMALFSVAGFAGNAKQAAQASTADAHGIVIADMDTSVKPGDSFHEYTTGGWMKRTEIPPDKSRVTVFSGLSDLSSKRTAALIQDMAKQNASAGSGARKIADLYKSYMDEASIEKKGLAPLQERLKEIESIRDKHELARVLGETLRSDVDPLNNTNFHTSNLFGMWVAPAFNDSDHYAPYLLQGGLGLPDREYYLANTEHMQSVRKQYEAYVARLMKLAEFSEPEKRAAGIVQLEHAIAEKHWNLEDDQDIHKVNNPWKRSEFGAKAPGLDWDEYFRGAGLSGQAEFIVWQPSAFTGEAELVNATELATWKDWLAYHVIDQYADVLPKAFADEDFAFFEKTLLGTPQQRPRWQRAVTVVNEELGDEVGKAYAQKYFPAEAKTRAQAMVANIVAAFRKRIDAVPWMTASTKAEAQEKLNQLYVGIGYPETWKDYSGFDVKPDDILGNEWRSSVYEYQRDLKRIGQTVNRQEWCMTPQTVNAVNLPLQNALNFPAAILQAPFYDPQAPDAVNYGAIGAIIGHEVSHTFDSEGSKFDAKGGLRNWWTASDLEHFNASTAKLARQYDSYKPFADLSLNGKQTLAENIADLAGVAASLDGYHAGLAGKTASSFEGFSGDQQFFIANGQSHRSKNREAALRRQIVTDPHSPSEYRTDTLRNIDAWYEAFHVQSGEKLYLPPDQRVKIW